LEKWWSGGKRAGNGFTEAEREAYFALTQADALTPLDASDMIGRSEVDCRIAMQALCGSCIVRRVGLGLGVYSLGARIFSEWVMQGSAPPRVPGKPANTRRGSKCSRFVISIHGIRTRGEWQKLLTRAMGREFTHEPWDYGDFSFLRLLRPGQRARQIDRFRDDYHRMRTDCGAIPSVVAHSFGTYIVANAMEKYPEICFDQMIFCGSIVPPDFRWSGFDEQRFARMLHDYGCLDIWAKLVEWVVPDAGGSGSWGFKDKAGGRIVERQHPLFDHSSYFYLGNFTENWIPFLSGRDPRSQPVPRLQEIRKWKVRLVALLGAVLLAGLVLVGFGW
jgi:pimeloyl-ACP methyl ester carboxylesterase